MTGKQFIATMALIPKSTLIYSEVLLSVSSYIFPLAKGQNNNWSSRTLCKGKPEKGVHNLIQRMRVVIYLFPLTRQQSFSLSSLIGQSK